MNIYFRNLNSFLIPEGILNTRSTDNLLTNKIRDAVLYKNITSRIIMNQLLKILFPAPPTPMAVSALILMSRLFFGMMFLNHGIEKWMTFDFLSMNFPDPLGIGNTLSLLCTIFAEVICSLCLIFGLLFRLALLPMIFAMTVALIAIHANDPFIIREPALMYLTIFFILLLSGPGYFSLDALIRQKIAR